MDDNSKLKELYEEADRLYATNTRNAPELPNPFDPHVPHRIPLVPRIGGSMAEAPKDEVPHEWSMVEYVKGLQKEE